VCPVSYHVRFHSSVARWANPALFNSFRFTIGLQVVDCDDVVVIVVVVDVESRRMVDNE